MNTEKPMSIEDRVRTATRVGATLVRDIRPFAEPDQIRVRRRPKPGTRRWSSWGVPLAAAAAVVLVAVSLVVVRQLTAKAPAPGGPTATPTSVPRYYVALGQGAVPRGVAGSPGPPGPEDHLIVGDDLTGKTIATVRPPHGMLFDTVQGASDDRTFVVMATREAELNLPPYTWYLLRIAPGAARPYQLTKLPITLPGGVAAVRAAALSPDGRDLAVESTAQRPHSAAIDTTLAVYAVSSGAELRAWTEGKDITQGLADDTLSWLSDGRRLVFSNLSLGIPRGSSLHQLRTIDLTGSGTALLADSRVLYTLSAPASGPGSCWSTSATPNGETVICGLQYGVLTGTGTAAGCADGGLEFTAQPAVSGRPVRVLYRYPGPCTSGLTKVLWTDASAAHVIGALELHLGNPGGKQTSRIGVIADGRIRLLTLPKSVALADVGTVAF